MAFQRLGACLFVVGVLAVLKGLERHLGVDHHVAPVGEMEYDIRNHPASGLIVFQHVAFFVSECLLRFVLQAFGETHAVEQFLKFEFPEVALYFVFARQCRRKAVCTLANRLCLLETVVYRRLQTRHCFGLLELAVLHSLSHLRYVCVQRIQDCGKLLLV